MTRGWCPVERRRHGGQSTQPMHELAGRTAALRMTHVFLMLLRFTNSQLSILNLAFTITFPAPGAHFTPLRPHFHAAQPAPPGGEVIQPIPHPEAPPAHGKQPPAPHIRTNLHPQTLIIHPISHCSQGHYTPKNTPRQGIFDRLFDIQIHAQTYHPHLALWYHPSVKTPSRQGRQPIRGPQCGLTIRAIAGVCRSVPSPLDF